MSEQIAFAPRDRQGRFMPAICPECGDKLAFDDGGNRDTPHWYCTGLIDPENDALPLAACEFKHYGDKPHD